MGTNKKSQEVLPERFVKTTFQILYGKELFDNYDNAYDELNDNLLL